MSGLRIGIFFQSFCDSIEKNQKSRLVPHSQNSRSYGCADHEDFYPNLSFLDQLFNPLTSPVKTTKNDGNDVQGNFHTLPDNPKMG